MRRGELEERIDQIIAAPNWDSALGIALEIERHVNNDNSAEETLGSIVSLVAEAIQVEANGVPIFDSASLRRGYLAPDMLTLAQRADTVASAMRISRPVVMSTDSQLASLSTDRPSVANLFYRALAALLDGAEVRPRVVPGEVSERIRSVISRPGEAQDGVAQAAADYLTRAAAQAGSGQIALMPGDLLFRHLNITGLGPFGHVGIYLGPPRDQPYAAQQNHEIVEMTAAGCAIGKLSVFQKGGFWGAYTVDLNDQQRFEVLKEALSYVGIAAYGRFGANYKNYSGRVFRCDGFVEHCYENLWRLGVLPPTLAHRQGLFEDDTYFNLSPAGLRNSTFRKL